MDDQRLANLLGALALAVADRVEAAAEVEAALDRTAAAALVAVANHPGETIDALSRVLGLSHSAAVRVVDRLRAAGLMERRPGAGGRAVALWPTTAGGERVASILDRRRAVVDPVLSGLHEDDRARLGGLLEKVLGGLPDSRVEARAICRLCDEAVCRRRGCPVDRAVSDPDERSRVRSEPPGCGVSEHPMGKDRRHRGEKRIATATSSGRSSPRSGRSSAGTGGRRSAAAG